MMKGNPVYRDVLKHAFRTAWSDRRYWPLAFFAALLLTAGATDVLFHSVDAISTQSFALTGSSETARNTQIIFQSVLANTETMFSALGVLQVILVLAILLIAVATLSCICQGGLVYAIGQVKRGKQPTMIEAMRVGGAAFWPVVALNALVIAAMWILRFFVALPLALATQDPSALSLLLYLISFIIFVPLSLIVTVIQIFALNALVIQGAPISEGIARGYLVFKKHWVSVVETACILFAISIGIGVLFVGALFVFALPVIAGIVLAAVLQSPVLFTLMLGIALALVIIGGVCAVAFTTQLQYATWTYLYRRLGEGGVIPKMHRMVRSLFRISTVRQ